MGFFKAVTSRATLVLPCVFLSAGIAMSQQLPTASSIAAEMGIAWNIGNTMEVPGDPTAWGNQVPTQALIDSAKAAGFSTIRIPCAWDSHADQTTLQINPDWIATVKRVVDYCIKDSLFVILNSHWDGGWLEENIKQSSQAEVNRKQGAYWRQIATAFKDYDRHLLFAGANEPAVQDPYGTPFGADRMAVLNSYHQTFIDSVRATGGNNASRTLIVQGPRSDIELTYQVMTTMPVDNIPDRLMAEVHFYPYQFTLMEQDESWGKVFYYWGQNNHSTTDTERNPTWGEEAYVDSLFNMMKTKFVDNGIPVILGEFGAMKRMTLTGEALERHILSRRTYYYYVVSAAKARGIIPVAWDTGYKGNKTMTIIDREGVIFDLGLLNAIRAGGGLPKLPGDTSLVPGGTGSKAMKILYSAKDSLWGQVQLDVVKPNFSTYDSIIVRAYVNGETDYDSAGVSKYGYVSLSLVTMSDSWKWREGAFGDVTMDSWVDYRIQISTNLADTSKPKTMVPANPAQIDFFALQAYTKGFRGTIYVDHIIFKTSSGVSDTLYSFDVIVPGSGKGNVQQVKSISVDAVESDQEWVTGTTTIWGPSSPVLTRASVVKNSVRTSVANGRIRATWFAPHSGTAQVTVRNLLGKTLFSISHKAVKGANSLEIPAKYSGMMILQIRQGETTFTGKMICN